MRAIKAGLLGSVIGTALLAVMGACSYVFVVRALDHTQSSAPATSPRRTGLA